MSSDSTSLTLRIGVFRPRLATLLAAVNEVHNAHHLVRRHLPQQGQPHVAVSFEIGQGQRHDEHFLVVAYVPAVGIPGGQADVEPGVARNQIAMHRPDLRQLTVRRGEERVENLQTQILFGRH